MILDDSAIQPPAAVSNERRYLEFREFLSQSGLRPSWAGFERGFAFTRAFEATLRAKVADRLASRNLQDEPVILHGQTGTGKTVALEALAHFIRKEQRFPALFIERRSQRLAFADVEAFCQWAETQGAPATAIVWDGMVEIDQYYQLTQYLAGRGRKTLVVGSYYLASEFTSRPNFIEAPARLSPAETTALVQFLNSFERNLGNLLEQSVRAADGTFLVALYRLLPPTRNEIRLGVDREVGVAEQELLKKAALSKAETNTTLGMALLKAGLLSDSAVLSSDRRKVGNEVLSQTQELIGLVMVPGRFGLRVPLDLLVRALGKEAWRNFPALLSDVDIFRWFDTEKGDITVAPRHPLEAKLLVQARFGSAHTELAFVANLLRSLRATSQMDDPEIQFGIDLLRSVGPNGDEADYFAPHFRELAATLRGVREERGLNHPRFALQEATLLRESVVRTSEHGIPAADAAEPLNAAAEVLRSALSLLQGDRNRRLRGAILVELAATIAAQARYALAYGAPANEAIRLFQEVRNNLLRSRILEPDNFYAVDVMAWSTKDVLTSPRLDSATQAEAAADLLHMFGTVEGLPLDSIQRERLQRRRFEIGSLLGQQELTDDAFRQLAEQGSRAGYFLRAAAMTDQVPSDRELSREEREIARQGAEYLQSVRSVIQSDGRCLHLLLRLWWRWRVGRPLFFRERQALPFAAEDWAYCAGVLVDLLSAGDIYKAASLKYLQALASFHLGKTQDAFDLFGELEREPEAFQGRRRIVRSYLASKPDGSPRVFSGTVSWLSFDGGKGEIYVDELRRGVTFFPRDFNRPDIQRNDALASFHIAFNFLGPIADPVWHYRP